MLARQRQERILEEVRERGGARMADLVELLGVSDMTVRRDIEALASWAPAAAPSYEIAFMPARVLMQDVTGVPALFDALAAIGKARTQSRVRQALALLKP